MHDKAPVDTAGPAAIMPTAIYSADQVCAAIQIGESKLKALVKAGRLQPMDYSRRQRFFGEDLVRLCRESSHTGRP